MINKFSNFNLSKELIKALDALEYKEPTGVQEKVIPEVLFNKDLIVKSQTGTGKTAAFGLPVIQKINIKIHSEETRGVLTEGMLIGTMCS